MIAMPTRVIGAQKRMARYYIQRLRDINTLYEQGGRNIRHALDQYDAESNQIEQTLTWLHTHSDDDADVADLFGEMLVVGRVIFRERMTVEQRLLFYQRDRSWAAIDTRLICLYEVAQVYLDMSQFEQAYKYAQQLYTLSEEVDDQEYAAHSMYVLGFVCNATGREADARVWLQEVVSRYLKMKNISRAVDCYKTLARVSLQLGEWARSEAHLDRAYTLLNAENDFIGKIDVLQILADLKEKTNDRDNVIHYRHEALEIAEVLDDRRLMVHVNMSLGVTYDNRAEFTKAQHHYRVALKIADKIGLHRYRLSIWGNLGYSHYLQGDYELARDYTEKSLTVLLDEQSHYLACVVMANLIGIYINLAALDEARQLIYEGTQIAVDLENPQLQVMMTVAAVQYLVARAQSNQQQDAIATGVLWAGFVYAAPQAEEENRTELDKLRPAMVALLGDAEVDELLAQGAALQLEAIIDHISYWHD